MKYKRRKTNSSRYISQTSDEKMYFKKFSLKVRWIIATIVVTVCFSFSRMNMANKYAIRNVFKQNSMTYGMGDAFENENMSFDDALAEKIKNFCMKFSDKKRDKASAFAKSEKEINSSGAKTSETARSDAAKVEKVPFAPINPCAGKISSGFGERVHPLSNEVSFHNGLDIAASTGTPVRACFDGEVETSEFNEFSGNYVIIKHSDGFTSSYAHMSEIKTTKGAKVKKGDVIGLVGSTGAATGPHLHFEIRQDGVAVNPDEYITGGIN